jgi:hypothetical protein
MGIGISTELGTGPEDHNRRAGLCVKQINKGGRKRDSKPEKTEGAESLETGKSPPSFVGRRESLASVLSAASCEDSFPGFG